MVLLERVMTTIDKKKFKIAVKNYRIQNDLTQKELADKLLTTTTTVARWEIGMSVPKNKRMISELQKVGIKI